VNGNLGHCGLRYRDDGMIDITMATATSDDQLSLDHKARTGCSDRHRNKSGLRGQRIQTECHRRHSGWPSRPNWAGRPIVPLPWCLVSRDSIKLVYWVSVAGLPHAMSVAVAPGRRDLWCRRGHADDPLHFVIARLDHFVDEHTAVGAIESGLFGDKLRQGE
jgi:hypothetical protein